MRLWLWCAAGLVLLTPTATADCHWEDYRCALGYGLKLVDSPSMQAADAGEDISGLHVRMGGHDGSAEHPVMLLMRPNQVNVLQFELDHGSGSGTLHELEMRLRVDGVVVTAVDSRTDPWQADVLPGHLPKQTGIVFRAGSLSPGWHPLDVGVRVSGDGGDGSIVRTIYACVPSTDVDPTVNGTVAPLGACSGERPAPDDRVQSYADWVKTLPGGGNGLQPGLTESTPGVAIATLVAGLVGLALVLRRRQ